MNEKINITKMDGAIVSADIIAFIENTTTSKRYVYYTLNETVGAGPSSTVKIYVSKLKQDNPTLDAPIGDEDWHMLKDIMSDSIKGVVTSTIKYLPLSELITPVSVSDKAIAMPVSYDYINKQRGLYAQSIAIASPTTETSAQATPAPVESPAPATESAPVENENIVQETVAPAVETPSEPAVAEPVPVTNVAPVEPTVVESTPAVAEEHTVVASADVTSETDSSNDSETGTTAVLRPIDLSEIEAKYAEMVEEINKLKEKELEAAKRYNATIELNSMHTEQHTNYVQSDIKENVQAASAPQAVEPVSAPIAPTVAPTIEPAQVTPVVPEAAPTASSADLETNWFDMPNN